jgi:hypothetical protein
MQKIAICGELRLAAVRLRVYILTDGTLPNGFYTVVFGEGQSKPIATGKVVIVGN